MKCPNCENTTDFDIKGPPGLSRTVKCAKCGYNGSEYQFADNSR